MIDKALLDILICPACGDTSSLEPDPVAGALVCNECGRAYPVREGIPVMLLEEAILPASRAGTDTGPPTDTP